jgi:hypothetical protein
MSRGGCTAPTLFGSDIAFLSRFLEMARVSTTHMMETTIRAMQATERTGSRPNSAMSPPFRWESVIASKSSCTSAPICS